MLLVIVVHTSYSLSHLYQNAYLFNLFYCLLDMKVKSLQLATILITALTLIVIKGMFIPIGMDAVAQVQILNNNSNSISLYHGLQDPQISTSANNSLTWLNSFDLQKCDLTSIGANTYFVLEPGYQLILEGNEEGKPIQLTITVLNETRLVNGTEARIVQEKTIEDGSLAEISNNYFAICGHSNDVFYFGEDTDLYKNGKIISHNGSWQAGIGNARAGMIMPGIANIGLKYYQELASGIDEGRAKIVSVDDVVNTPVGKFDRVLKTEETSPLEPGNKEYKLYAPGIGLIQDDTLKLVNFTQSKIS
jgi:hypothetical protein